ncbi:hypothetical protein GIB67_004950 [Kingdonia uniflora]|uniref:Uncharacterized protein n=1 Tax=Kingdonia uniflora TaxID=39325 RepID=A0A7J7NN92_9MAGN|nr:hypothetical protein GIB67_004950 [Kingdonia uniflora]
MASQEENFRVITPRISEDEKKRLLHSTIIGGGPIEANEIRLSFNIVVRQYATKHLTKCGAHLKKGVVKEVYPKKIVLSDVTDIPYGLLVWSTAVGPSNFIKSLNLPKSHGGRIGIDE